jgi:hypothetical protein
MLTRGFQPLIGKPGQSNSPVGRKLNVATNDCVNSTIRVVKNRLRNASHTKAAHKLALAEAFPSAFLGVLIKSPERLSAKRGNRSDRFFAHACNEGLINKLLSCLLPGRQVKLHPSAITNHDERAALICALTALCVVRGTFVAVGDDDGRIILPPPDFVQPWAKKILQHNAEGAASLLFEA